MQANSRPGAFQNSSLWRNYRTDNVTNKEKPTPKAHVKPRSVHIALTKPTSTRGGLSWCPTLLFGAPPSNVTIIQGPSRFQNPLKSLGIGICSFESRFSSDAHLWGASCSLASAAVRILCWRRRIGGAGGDLGRGGELGRRLCGLGRRMLIDFASSGMVVPQSGAGISSCCSFLAFPRVLGLLLLLVVGAFVVFYGRSLSWKVALSSSQAGAWVRSQFEKDPARTRNKTVVKDHRLKMDFVAARRLSRDKFLELHREFDFGAPPHKDRAMGLNVTESYVRNSRNLEIFVKSWVPAEARPKGVLFICHGYGDTVTFFNEGLARALAVAGYAVYGMDYPGFGLSEGLHGYIPDFDVLVNDVVEQYRIIKDRPENKGLSCFLFGESMGGAVALKAHLKDASLWDGAILVAPMCKIADAMYPPWFLVQIMIALAHVIPKAKLVPGRDLAKIGFRDVEKRNRASYNPVAYVGNPRLGTALQLLQTTDFVESKLAEVSLPLLVLHGAADQVTDPFISGVLHEKAKSEDKTLKLYEGAWHCLLQGEPDEMVKRVMLDIVTWLDARAAFKGDFGQQNEKEMEARVSAAAPNLIEFGKFDAVKELL